MPKRLTLEYISNKFSDRGYKLLSKNYKNSRQKLCYVCPNGHKGYIKWDHFRDGHGCSVCAGNAKLNIEYINKEFKKEGYRLLSDKYVNSHTELKYECPNGHIYKITWNNWKTGYRCLECSGRKKKTLDVIRNAVDYEGYKLLADEYKNCHQKLHLVCSNGHDYYVSWDNWNHSNSRCIKCKEWGISKQESRIIDFLKKHSINIIEHDRQLASPYELDVVAINRRIAVEYCGLYWHSELAGKDNKYHLNKLTKSEDAGIRLVTIFEDELVQNCDLVFSRLKNIFNIDDGVIKIFARQCDVKEIDTSSASIFCNKYHSQGYCGSSVKLGLFYNGDLISVMTFAKPSISKGYRNYSKNVWELSRFCSKIGYNVVGGASKLLKYFERNYIWKEIFSYADRRWSVGNLYKKLGFEFIDYIKPNYWYIKDQKRVHRFSLRKTDNDPKDQTEWQIRRSQGWNRIWDCGNLKYKKINASYY